MRIPWVTLAATALSLAPAVILYLFYRLQSHRKRARREELRNQIQQVEDPTLQAWMFRQHGGELRDHDD
jgi:hypothetical protein